MLRKIAVFALVILLCGFIGSFAGDAKTEIDPNITSVVTQNTEGLAEKEGLTAPARDEALNKEAIMAKAAELAVPFVANVGQFHNDVRFSADLFAGSFFLTGKELVYSLVKSSGRKSAQRGRFVDKPQPENMVPDKVFAFKEFFVDDRGKSIDLQPVGEDQAVTKVSYFRGNDPAKWQSGLASYKSVSLGQVYPGVEVKLKASRKNVEKVFVVSPGSDVGRIKISVAGVKRLKVSKDGQLLFKNGIADLSMRAPVAWQEINGKRHDVKVVYRLLGKRQYGFAMKADYDKNHSLLIDPALDTLLASTYLGGTGGDDATALALDPEGNVYVTGYTNSPDFPTSIGAYDRIINPEAFSSYTEYHWYLNDVFVSKLNGNLTELISSTYLGGTWGPGWGAYVGDDSAFSLILDRMGNVFVCGNTESPDFPTTPGAYDRIYNGGTHYYDPMFYGDAFISKLSGNLTQLVASTFLGGTDRDCGRALGMDSAGNVYLTGSTMSEGFPVTIGAYDSTYNGNALDIGDIFISKLDNNLTSLISSTYLGGNVDEEGKSIILDPEGNIYLTGWTSSEDFPTTPGAYDQSYNGPIIRREGDVIISKMNNDLSILLASTYLGGSYYGEFGTSLALDSSGNVFLTGVTGSYDFPTTPGVYNREFRGGYTDLPGDLFISKLDDDLSVLLASTFLTQCDGMDPYSFKSGSALTLDRADNVFVTGVHASECFYEEYHAVAFVSKVDKDLTTLLGQKCMGGFCSNPTYGSSLALDTAGNVYFTGVTYSNFPTTDGVYDQTHNGFSDAFVSKLNGSSIGITVTSPNGGERWGAGTTQNIAWTSVGTVGSVTIDCSFDNGISWRNVAVTGNDGSYAWTVPNTLSDQCLVRISDAAYPVVSDMSDAVFAIVNAPPQVDILIPTDNATVYGMVQVKASAIDDGGVARVEFYVDGVLKGNTTASHSADKHKLFSSGISGDSKRVKKAFADSPTPQSGAKGLDVTSPYTFIWNAMEASPGAHVLRVAAYDGLGAMGFDEVTVQVIQLKLDLQAERREVRAYSILRYYGQVGFTVDNPGVPVAGYRVMRRKGGSDFALLRTIALSEVQDNTFAMQDKYLEKGVSYTYRVEAIDAAGQLVGRSAEKTI